MFEQNDLSVGLDYLPSDIARHVNKNVCNGGGGSKAQTTSSGLDEWSKQKLNPIVDDVLGKYKSGQVGQLADDTGVRQALAAQQQLAGQAMQGLDTSELDRINKQAAQQGLGTGAQEALFQQQMQQGLGTENLLNELRASEGAMLGGNQGALGSARASRAREAGLADRAMQLQQADQAAKAQAAGQLTNLSQANLAARQGAGQGLVGSRQASLGQQQQAANALGQIAQQGRGLDQQQLDAPLKAAKDVMSIISPIAGKTQTTTGGGGK